MNTDDAATTEEPPAQRAPLRRVLFGLLLGAVLLGLGLTSAALFSDTAETGGLGVDVGTVDVATAPVTLLLEASALAPGDVVATPLEIRNDGSLELRYSMTSTVDDPSLADLLELEVRVDVTSCDPVGAAADGTLLAGPVRLGGLTADPVVGDPAPGADAGDRVLGPGDSEVLCLRVELPADVAEDEAAGLAVVVEVQVDAEQTTANP